MSIQNLSFFGKFCRNKYSNAWFLVKKNFSRKSSGPVEDPYKVVRGRRATKVEEASRLACRDPNFELLTSTEGGFPFVLPGNVGIGWYDTDTTLQVQENLEMELITEEAVNSNANIILRVQPCPTVLRKTVCDLFPYKNLETVELSVVTISLKPPSLRLLRKNKEIETEKLAQTFVITAKSICDKLSRSGYWADFVNPFSGRPYLYPNCDNKLYQAHEKFRCLDFQIFDIQHCKVISNEEEEGFSNKRRFTGSLFTNAPSKKNHLNGIFTKEDY